MSTDFMLHSSHLSHMFQISLTPFDWYYVNVYVWAFPSPHNLKCSWSRMQQGCWLALTCKSTSPQSWPLFTVTMSVWTQDKVLSFMVFHGLGSTEELEKMWEVKASHWNHSAAFQPLVPAPEMCFHRLHSGHYVDSDVLLQWSSSHLFPHTLFCT